MNIFQLAVKCQKNCTSKEFGVVDLQTGENAIELKPISQNDELKIPFGILSFRISPRSTGTNAKAEIEVRWQDVLLSHNSSYLKNGIEFRIPIHSFKTPSSLKIKITLNLGPEHFTGSLDDHSHICATLDDLKFVKSDNVLQGRKRLLLPAQLTSKTLGLSGDYLTEDRITAIENRLNLALIQRKPFSAVRLGDGEGRVLGYPSFFSDLEVLSEVLYYHFGPESMNKLKDAKPDTWIKTAMDELRGLLTKSLRQADMVGLPISEFFNEHERNPSTGLVGYACALTYGLTFAQHLNDDDIVGTNVFQVLAARGRVIKSAAVHAKATHVVGPWDITHELGEALGAEINWIKVPGHYTWRGEKGMGHYPELYRYVETKLMTMGDLSGQLFLVGAGILGKYYCALIKERGGVALDVGSVLDSLVKRGLPYAVSNDAISFKNL